MVQQLPPSASVVEAILPGLSYLDSRAAAALLKGLAKAGLGQRAVDVFDYLRCAAAHLSSTACCHQRPQPQRCSLSQHSPCLALQQAMIPS